MSVMKQEVRTHSLLPVDHTVLTHSLVGICSQMLSATAEIFFSKFGNMEVFRNNPEVVEEFFFLMAMCLKECPTLLFQSADSNRLGQFVTAGIYGLQLEHKKAQKGVLQFFRDLISVACTADTTPEMTQIKGIASQIIGHRLTHSCICSLTH